MFNYYIEALEMLEDCELNTDVVEVEDFARDFEMLEMLELAQY